MPYRLSRCWFMQFARQNLKVQHFESHQQREFSSILIDRFINYPPFWPFQPAAESGFFGLLTRYRRLKSLIKTFVMFTTVLTSNINWIIRTWKRQKSPTLARVEGYFAEPRLYKASQIKFRSEKGNGFWREMDKPTMMAPKWKNISCSIKAFLAHLRTLWHIPYYKNVQTQNKFKSFYFKIKSPSKLLVSYKAYLKFSIDEVLYKYDHMQPK